MIVCRFGELRVGDQFLDPGSGALARVDLIERGKIGPVVQMTMVASHTRAKLELHPRRPMRRKLRKEEEDGSQTNTRGR